MSATPVVLPPVSAASPIVKWAGGKGQLLEPLRARLPSRWNRYAEPFAGGGALFFALAPKKAVLADRNAELMGLYEVVRDRVEELIAALAAYRYERAFYYRIRAQVPSELDPIGRAARFLYLNKTCFNGLYRVNRSGQFNVPFGRYANPRICDAPRLRKASAALRSADLRVGDFTAIADRVGRNDLLYFDPPYVPLSRTAAFTAYTAGSFGEADQERLAAFFVKLDRKGCRLMLSNSDTPWVRRRYAGFRIERVAARRSVNAKAWRRGPVHEVIVRNYR